MEVGNIDERKRQLRHPRDDEIVDYNGDIIDALEKLKKGKTVFCVSKKLSILMRRYGGAACVKIIRWKGRSIFQVDPISEN
ncbi:MAG: hypothetical protein WED07_12665 [Candidatus Freyarchaeum deiterrae]